MTELMGEPMAAFDELPRIRRGPLHALYAALRRRAPQVSATRPDDDEAGLRVAYRGQSGVVVWDGELALYAWRPGSGDGDGSGGGAGGQLGSDVEKTAELVAWTLGASVTSGGTA
ncbi:hypothetical protein [Actinomadura monticuli]|uniref:Uncharacterized protein n=1 Tax=Actinomadura monticuli TaxID=3097367 RepID=A0ABV4QAH9_9ACTN